MVDKSIESKHDELIFLARPVRPLYVNCSFLSQWFGMDRMCSEGINGRVKVYII